MKEANRKDKFPLHQVGLASLGLIASNLRIHFETTVDWHCHHHLLKGN